MLQKLKDFVPKKNNKWFLRDAHQYSPLKPTMVHNLNVVIKQSCVSLRSFHSLNLTLSLLLSLPIFPSLLLHLSCSLFPFQDKILSELWSLCALHMCHDHFLFLFHSWQKRCRSQSMQRGRSTTIKHNVSDAYERCWEATLTLVACSVMRNLQCVRVC